MVLKLAKSYTHAMISALLLYLQWKFATKEGVYALQTIVKWFKPAVLSRAANTYWDPRDECVKNTSDKLLDIMNTDMDDLYWVVDQVPPSPKRTCTQVEDESMNDSVLMVKMVVTQKHQPQKSALKQMANTAGAESTICSNATHMVVSQASAISQLMEQVSQIKLETNRFSNGLTSLQHKWKPSWLNPNHPIDAMPKATEMNPANCHDANVQQGVRRGPPTLA